MSVAAPSMPIDDASIQRAIAAMLAEATAVRRPKKKTPSYVSNVLATNTTLELERLEAEHRESVECESGRLYTKIVRSCVEHEYCTEQQVQLLREEERARASIEHDHNEVVCLGEQLTLQGDESRHRFHTFVAYRRGLRHLRNLRNVERFVFREEVHRGDLLQQEAFELAESRQRRLIEVGQDVQMAIIRQNADHFLSFMAGHTMLGAQSERAIFAEEATVRASISKVSLLSLAQLYRSAEAELSNVVLRDIRTLSSLTTSQSDDATWRQHTERLLSLNESEGSQRRMIDQDRSTQLTEYYSSFMLGWRDLRANVEASGDARKVIVYHESVSRHYISDHHRLMMASFAEEFDHRRREIASRDQEREALYRDFLDGIVALWGEEHSLFAALVQERHQVIGAARCLQESQVVLFHERKVRQRMLADEVWQVLLLRIEMLLERCRILGYTGVWEIVAEEEREFEEIASRFRRSWQQDPMMVLSHQETVARLALEEEEDQCAVKAYAEGHRLLQSGLARQGWNFLFRMEHEWRASLKQLEYRERTVLRHTHAVRREVGLRNCIRAAEERERRALYAKMLVGVESWNRACLKQAENESWSTLSTSALLATEKGLRKMTMEEESHCGEPLFLAVNHQNPFVRSCRVDEMRSRLAVIEEAEFAFRAAAYMFGHNACVSLCSQPVRWEYRGIEYFSTQELLAERMKELEAEKEPSGRRAMEAQQSFELALLAVEYDEDHGRIEIRKLEEEYATLMHRVGLSHLPVSVSSVVDSTTLRTARQDLLRYLGAHPPGTPPANRVAKIRRQLREAIRSFLLEFFWSRDSLLFEESVSRRLTIEKIEGMVRSLPTIALHSIVVEASDGRIPTTVRLWHSSNIFDIRGKLECARQVFYAGTHIHFLTPTEPLKWTGRICDHFGGIFLVVLDQHGRKLHAGTSPWRSDPTDTMCVPILLGAGKGRANLVIHV